MAVLVIHRLIDGDWVRVDTITRMESAICTKRFSDVGSIELTLPTSADIRISDIVIIGDFSGIVLKIEKSYENLKVYGYDLSGLTSFRTIPETTIPGGTNIVEALYSVVSTALTSGDRAIEHLAVVHPQGFDYTTTEDIVIAGKLSQVLNTVLGNIEIGYDIAFNSGELTFFFVKPVDSEVIFSRENHNLQNAQNIIDDYSTVNCIDILSSDVSGVARREGDAIQPLYDYLTAKSADITGMGCKLGDIVRIKEFDSEYSLMITELQRIIEPTNQIIVPTFGIPKKNIFKQIIEKGV